MKEYSELIRASQERADQIVARLKAGETQAAVSKDYGITYQRVGQIARARGYYSRPKRGPRKSPLQSAEKPLVNLVE